MINHISQQFPKLFQNHLMLFEIELTPKNSGWSLGGAKDYKDTTTLVSGQLLQFVLLQPTCVTNPAVLEICGDTFKMYETEIPLLDVQRSEGYACGMLLRCFLGD